MEEVSKRAKEMCFKPLVEVREELLKKLGNFDPFGTTALGSAVLSALAVAQEL